MRNHAASADRSSGFTLVELLLTIVILAILAAALIPQLTGDLPERLDAAAQVVVADLEYARSLAVANNSSYRVTFECDNNLYYLQHSGSNNLLNVLPSSPFRQNDDPPDRQTTDLAALPIPQPAVRLIAVVEAGGGPPVASLGYEPLGGTLSQVETVIWLGCGTNDNERFLPIHVHPVTGLAEAGLLQADLPAEVEAVLP